MMREIHCRGVGSLLSSQSSSDRKGLISGDNIIIPLIVKAVPSGMGVRLTKKPSSMENTPKRGRNRL